MQPDPLALEMLEAARAQAAAARDAVIVACVGAAANLLVVLVAIGLPAYERRERRAEHRRRQEQSKAEIREASQKLLEELAGFKDWMLALPAATLNRPDVHGWEDSFDRRQSALRDAGTFMEDADVRTSVEHLAQIAARARQMASGVPPEPHLRPGVIEAVQGLFEDAETSRKRMLDRLITLRPDNT